MQYRLYAMDAISSSTVRDEDPENSKRFGRGGWRHHQLIVYFQRGKPTNLVRCTRHGDATVLSGNGRRGCSGLKPYEFSLGK